MSSAAAQVRELLAAPMHARGIYDQQYQLHRLVTEQIEEPVAVNDLGHIAFDNPDRVVDLWGLGDSGARVARFEAADGWMAQIMDERDVEVAIVYKPWFSGSIPKDWILVAKQYNPLSEGGPALRTVHLYATDEAAADRLAAALDRFEPTFPDRTTYEIFRPAPAAG